MTQLVAVRVYYYQIDAKLPESAQPARPPPPEHFHAFRTLSGPK